MAWTSPYTFVAGTALLAAKLNEQLRDNATYLKGVLDGTDLQDVTFHDNKTVKQGAFWLHRSPHNKGHIERGTAVSSSGAGVAVTFANAFASAPVVTLTTQSTGFHSPQLDSAPSTTGFTFSTRDQNGNRTNGVTVHWFADGAD